MTTDNTDTDEVVLWSHDDPENPYARDRSHIHRIVPDWMPPCTCIHCQTNAADNNNQQEET